MYGREEATLRESVCFDELRGRCEKMRDGERSMRVRAEQAVID